MKSAGIAALLLTASLTSFSSFAAPPPVEVEGITVAPGATGVINVPGIIRVAVDNPEVITATVDQKAEHVIVTGKKVGKALVLVWIKGDIRKPYAVNVVAGSSSSAPLAAKSDELTLKKGEKRDVAVGAMTRVAVGDPDVCDVTVGAAGHITVTGLKAGQTKMLIWLEGNSRKEFEVTVK